MNWLVTWMVISWSMVACPPPAPVYDAYRGEIQSSINTTALACYDTEEKPMQKYFSTYEEAFEFVKNGKLQCISSISDFGYTMSGDCDLKDFEIIKLNDN